MLKTELRLLLKINCYFFIYIFQQQLWKVFKRKHLRNTLYYRKLCRKRKNSIFKYDRYFWMLKRLIEKRYKMKLHRLVHINEVETTKFFYDKTFIDYYK